MKVLAQAGSRLAGAPDQSAKLTKSIASAPRLATPSSRRELLAASIALVGSSAFFASPAAAELPPPPQTGDCPECIGEVNDSLNACSLESNSCISTLNEDEIHFEAPWEFNGTTEDAVTRLIDIACGGAYAPGLINEPFGISRVDAAGYVVKGVLAVLKNGDMPEQPKRRRQAASIPFDGVVAERHTTANGSEYVRITLGTKVEGDDTVDPVGVIDAEFLFLKNDSIVNVRAASRVQPDASGLGLGSGGELALSFTSGLVVDRNVARRRMDSLRSALDWELAAVLADFDPKFNPEAPVWLERVFQPFSERNEFKPSGVSYPVDE